MPVLPFAFTPILWLVVIGTVLGGAFVLVDAIGDRREARVRAEYAEAARKKNIEIGNFNSADDAVAALVDAALAARAQAAGQVAGACPATKDQAKALTELRRVR